MTHNPKLTFLVVVLLSTLPRASAQRSDIGLEATAHLGLTEHWSAFGMANFDVEDGNTTTLSVWGRFGAGAGFTIYESIIVFGCAAYSTASYYNIDNRDAIYTLMEGAFITTQSHFVHAVTLEQRKLKFLPSERTVNCTRATYYLGRDFAIGTSPWSITSKLGCVVNVKSEVSSSNVLQRVKLRAGVARKLSERLNVGVEYGYMFLGKKQIYMGERHNLHAVKIRINFACK